MVELTYVLLAVGVAGALFAAVAYRRVSTTLDRVLLGVVLVACGTSALLAALWLIDGAGAA